jgi:hypothetical protein
MNTLEYFEWIEKHLRYTQALCEIILENLPDKEKEDLIRKVKERVKEIS